jgi:AraC family transcriptional regulator, transcriptional activator of the genes for pyochelin and ferripyochelin receptors
MDERIRVILRFIEERGGALQITPKQIGSLLGLGEVRVLRLFRTEVGTTLRRHLLEVRMARAAELLRTSDLPIKTIAFDCGYSLVSNFHRDFKLVNGISPKQMRLTRMNIRPPHEIPALAQRTPSGHSGVAAVAVEGTPAARRDLRERSEAANE